MNRFSTAETSQEQGDNIIFNLCCNISEQASEIVAVLSCITLYKMLRGAVVLSTGEVLSEEFFFCGEGGETGIGCPGRW